MNIGNTKLESQMEKAIQMLVQFMPVGEDRKKPILMHSIRVGMYLYQNNYSEEVVISGLLHDILEWTKSPEEIVKNEFGEKVLAIVKSNTKNREIVDSIERRKDYIDRCIETGENALIVKAADTLDSYHFYSSTNDADEIERSINIAKTILEKLPENFHDPIFTELQKIQKL